MSDKSKTTESKNWFLKHKVISAIGLIILIIIIGSAASGGPNNTAVNTKSSDSASGSSKKSTSTAHIGSTVDVGGSKGLAVTVQKIIDPATGADQFTTPDAGKRFVAVQLEIKNNGTASYNDDANSNVTLIGSDNQSYTADFDSIAECTNFNDGQYTLAAGETATGCVVFQVPDAVKSAKVQFQTISGLDSSTGEWLAQ